MPDGPRELRVVLTVPDHDSAVRFYRDVLGLEETYRRPGAVFMWAGGYHHHIALNAWERPGGEPPDPGSETPPIYVLKNAVEDLKAYYVEGITAQPGQGGASSQVLQNWFWDDTVAGEVLLKLKQVCEQSDDRLLSMMGKFFMVPGDVARRKATTG